jgi:hypothetical protein
LDFEAVFLEVVLRRVAERFGAVLPLARRFTLPSASVVSFLSAAFSSFRLALSRGTTLSWPNYFAQAISVP